MIKRRYFRQDHGESGSSSDSSSDSDSVSDASAQEEEELDESTEPKQINEDEEEEGEESDEEKQQSEGELEEYGDVEPSLLLPDSDSDSDSSHGSEDSSENEIEEDSLGLVATMEEQNEIKKQAKSKKTRSDKIGNIKDNEDKNKTELDSCILKWKSVFKCKFCPKIVCLSEKIVKQHLESKNHKRSKKLFEEGKLKVMLNSDGELEEDYETHAERYARTMALAEAEPRVAKKDSGRKRQRLRKKKKLNKGTEKKAEQQIEISKKKKQKTKD